MKGVGALRWKVKTGFIDWKKGGMSVHAILADGAYVTRCGGL